MPGQVQSVGTAEAVAFQLQSRANSQPEVTTWLPSGYQMVYRRYSRLVQRRDAQYDGNIYGRDSDCRYNPLFGCPMHFHGRPMHITKLSKSLHEYLQSKGQRGF